MTQVTTFDYKELSKQTLTACDLIDQIKEFFRQPYGNEYKAGLLKKVVDQETALFNFNNKSKINSVDFYWDEQTGKYQCDIKAVYDEAPFNNYTDFNSIPEGFTADDLINRTLTILGRQLGLKDINRDEIDITIKLKD